MYVIEYTYNFILSDNLIEMIASLQQKEAAPGINPPKKPVVITL